MKNLFVLLTIIVLSAYALSGCQEDEQANPKTERSRYVDRYGSPMPVEEQLVCAARDGDLAHLKKLHTEGADLSMEHQGRSPFEAALKNRQAGTLQYLLDNGIDQDTNSGSERNPEDPLAEMIRSGWFEGVRLLVSRGADVNKYDKEDRYSVTLYAGALAYGHVGIARYLADNGADPAWKREDGYNALFAAIDDDPPQGGIIPSALRIKKSLSAARCAVENGADINAVYRDMTPLIMAAAYGQKDTYEYLVGLGAKPDKKDKFGNTPAEYLARLKLHPKQFGKFYKNRALATMITPDVPLKSIQAIVDKEYADFNVAYSKEYTPLTIAAVFQRKDIYDFLVKSGADTAWQDEYGNRAEEYLTGVKQHPGSLFTQYYANLSEGEPAPEKHPGEPLDYSVFVRYSNQPIKIWVNGTIAASAFDGGRGFIGASCKDYLKKGANTVRITWGAMPSEAGWDASVARYIDPLSVSVELEARYDKNGKDKKTIFWKNLSRDDAVSIEGGMVPAYEFTFYSDLDSPLKDIVAQAQVCNATAEEADANVAQMRKVVREMHAKFTAGRHGWLLEKAAPRIENLAASSGSSVKEITAGYKNSLQDIRKQGLGYTLQSDEQIVLLPSFGGRLWAVGVMESAGEGKRLMESVKTQAEAGDKADYHLFQSKRDGGLSQSVPITIAKINGKFVIVR